jgi:hypothetical protein
MEIELWTLVDALSGISEIRSGAADDLQFLQSCQPAATHVSSQ